MGQRASSQRSESEHRFLSRNNDEHTSENSTTGASQTPNHEPAKPLPDSFFQTPSISFRAWLPASR